MYLLNCSFDKKRLCLLLGLLLYCISLNLAATNSSLKVKRLSIWDGLSQNHINDITQDKQGFIWLATDDGLNRYDGYSFKHYSYKSGDDNSIPSQYIVSLLHDEDYLWIGTRSGLARMNLLTEKIKTFSSDKDKPNTLASSFINQMAKDSDGSLWFATRHGLSHFNPDNEQFTTYYTKDYLTDLSTNNFLSLYIDKNQTLWAGTSTSLFRFNKKNKQLIPINFIKKLYDSSPKLDINAITEDRFGKLWIGLLGGIYHFDPVNERVIDKYQFNFNISNGLSNHNIEDIKVDLSNNLWIATRNGLNHLNHKTKEITKHFHNPGDLTSLSANYIQKLFLDRDGGLWIGTNTTGANYWNPDKNWFRHLQHNPLDPNSLTDRNVWDIYKSNDFLFVATDNGLDIFNLKTGIKENFQPQANNPESISHYTVYGIKPDINNPQGYWIYTLYGLNYFDLNNKKFKRYKHNNKNPESIAHDNIYRVIQDKEHNTWIGTHNGLSRYHPKSDSFTHYRHDNSDPNSISNNIARAITISPYAQFWIGTANGLNLFNPKTNTFKRYLSTPERAGESSTFNPYDINSIFQQSPSILWVGYGGNGLRKLDFSKNSEEPIISNYSNETGFPMTSIYSLIYDRQGHFWIADNYGLIRFNPNTLEILSFDVRDGLQSNEFNENSNFVDDNGDIYLGGVNGITIFNPADIRPSKKPANTIITDIGVINDQSVTASLNNVDNSIHLSHEQTAINISFSLLDYKRTDKNTYRYMLQGYDKDWVHLQSKHDVTYTNLDPGDYHFKVIGINKYGVESLKPASIKIHISPPLWKSYPAYALYLILILSIAGTYTYRKKQKEQEKERFNQRIRVSEENLKLALWGSDENMWHWDAKTDEVYYNNLHELLGYDERELKEKLISHRLHIHSDDRKHAILGWNAHLFNNKDYIQTEYRIQNKSGKWIWIRERGRAVKRDLHGLALRITGTYKDISQQKSIDDELKLLAKAFENTSEAVVILSKRNRVQAANNAFFTITDYTPEQLKKIKLNDFFTSTNKKKIYQKIWKSIINTEQWQGELLLKRKHGETFPAWVTVSVLRNDSHETTHFVVVFSDITERKRSEEDLKRLANYDILTGLPNRALFDDRLSRAIIQAKRRQKFLAVYFIDIDRFKQINDSFGHAIGDYLLKRVTERISHILRDEDTLSRISGDEFILLIENIRKHRDVTLIAKSLINCMKQPFKLENQEIIVSISVGISIYPKDGKNIRTLLKNADTAMYHAKSLGRNNFQFYTQEMNAKALERLTLESALKKAVNNLELQLYYQPQVDSNTNIIVGMESLLRWVSPNRGIISPGVFIPLAEESSLIIDLGEWVMRSACEQIAQWLKQGITTLQVAVNLSPRQFQRSDLLPLLADIIQQTKIPPQCLELEITESALLSDISQTMDTLSALNRMGIKLAIDDFGTGYSSLMYLKRFPIHTLKIDQHFMQNVSTDEKDQAIVSTIINLSEKMDLKVIAEGIETIEQLNFLKQHHCTIAQGYYFAKPMPAEEILFHLQKGVIIPEHTNKAVLSINK